MTDLVDSENGKDYNAFYIFLRKYIYNIIFVTLYRSTYV